MRYHFSMEMDNLGRMEARVLGLLERVQAELVVFSSIRIRGQVFVHGLIEVDERELVRLEALALKIEGMSRVRFLGRGPSLRSETTQWD